MNEKPTSITPEDFNTDISALEALIGKYTPHLAGDAHLITSTGALRTAVACLKNHLEALAKKTATPPAA